MEFSISCSDPWWLTNEADEMLQTHRDCPFFRFDTEEVQEALADYFDAAPVDMLPAALRIAWVSRDSWEKLQKT